MKVKLFKSGLLITLILFIISIVLLTGGLLYMRHCDWNPEDAAKYATEHAENRSIGMCALYVRKAINAGGILLFKCGSVWHYRYVLHIINFKQVGKQAERKVGDIAVFQPIGGR